jgi:hypothetical protein
LGGQRNYYHWLSRIFIQDQAGVINEVDIRYGLQWKDAPSLKGCTKPSKTASSAGAAGVLSGSSPPWRPKPGMPEQLMIDSTHLKAHRTPPAWLQRGICAVH